MGNGKSTFPPYKAVRELLLPYTVLLLILDLSAQTDTKLSEKSDKAHNHDSAYYTKAEISALISDAKTEAFDDAQELVDTLEAQTETKLSGKSDKSHIHDDRYYTAEEADYLLSGKSNTSHTHDGRYYTESETDELISQTQNNSMLMISDLSTQTDQKLSEKSDKSHNHDSAYYTKAEVSSLISDAADGLVPQTQLNGLTLITSSSVPTVDDRTVITFVTEA